MANYDWEISNLKGEIKTIRTTLYGNGQEGITSRAKGLEDEMRQVLKWKNEWHNITSLAEHAEMKKKLNQLTQDRWFIIGVFSVVNLLIVVFGQKLVNIF